MSIHDPAGPFHQYWLPASRGGGLGVTACTLEEAMLMAGAALSLLPPGAALSDEVLEADDEGTFGMSPLPAGLRASRVHGVWYPRGE